MAEEDMHKKVGWIVPADRPILQTLSPNVIDGLSAKDIAYNTGYGYSHVRNRLKLLVEAGLIERHDEADRHPKYHLTDDGEKYLKNELSPEYLRELMDEGNEQTD